MNFWQLSDGIRLHHQAHHGHGGHSEFASGWPDSSLYSRIDTGDDGAGDGGNGFFSGLGVNAPVAILSLLDASHTGTHGRTDADQSNLVQINQHAVQLAGIGGNGGNDNVAAGGNILVSEPHSGSAHAHAWLGSATTDSGANTAGNGGDGYFYGGIIHASMVVYEPINISVSAGYGSIALADQTNNASFDQSAVQMAGIGGNGGNGNIASGGNVSMASSGADEIATGGNSAGNGGHGIFSGTLVDAPIVVYHPINIAVAGPGGTAEASQSNTMDINQVAIQIAGVGGNGGNGNAAIGGDVSTLGSGSASGGWEIQSGDSHAGNGGDGYAYGGLVHASFALYDPINIAVAGYNSSANATQINNVHLDQSSSQTAGVGEYGGSGHFSGSLIDVSVAIYAPINIAIAGPHSTAEADQVNNVHIDQSAIQMAGIGGNGGHGNVALGGDVTMHLLSDLHLMS